MNIAVVDDEQVIREQICSFIKKENPEYCIEAYSTGKALLDSGHFFDIIFLDIQMEGINGIETARKLREKTTTPFSAGPASDKAGTASPACGSETVLIFITGLREYVFDAFDVSAFHYLLKPIEETKFTEVFQRAVTEAKKRKQQHRQQLFLKSKGQLLNQSDILYLESRGKKVALHTLKETIEIYAVLGELEQQLSDSFYRCHRGYLVNMAFITEFDLDSITLNNGEKIYLTRKKHKEFAKIYMWYLQNGGISCV